MTARSKADSPVGPDTPPAPQSGAPDAAALIPGWLALLVLLLLLAVAGLGGYLLRGALAADEAATPTQYAVQDLEAQVEAEPDDPETMLSLGYAYQEEGRYDEAVKVYDEVLAIDQSNTGALYNEGVCLSALGEPKKAEAVFWDLLEIAPDHALAAKALGEYYVGKQQYKSALVALEPVIVQRPEYADLQYLAGYSCEQLGLAEQAVAYYRGALTYNTGYQEAKDGLARLGATE